MRFRSVILFIEERDAASGAGVAAAQLLEGSGYDNSVLAAVGTWIMAP